MIRENHQMKNELIFRRIILVAILFYLGLFGYNSLTRTRNFSEDSMNYIDVARNIKCGLGITQSTLGFNQPRFSPDTEFPVPLTAQPPLYPLFIALTSHTGISPKDTSLIISFVSYLLLLYLVYKITIFLYDKNIAFLAVGLLLVYYPIKLVCRYACSEPLCGVFLFTSIWLLLRIDFQQSSKREWITIILSGLFAGFAFATRLAVIFISLAAVIYLFIESKQRRQKLQNILLYLIGFLIIFGSVLGRHLILTGTIFTEPNPSSIGIREVVKKMVFSLLGRSINMFHPRTETIIIGSLILIVFIILIIQKRAVQKIADLSLRKKRYILLLWSGLYLLYLISQRTRYHFDPITPRFVFYAGVPLIILGCVFIIKALRFKPILNLCFILIIAIISIQSEIRLLIHSPKYEELNIIRGSERLTWIADNTTNQDLIIGNNTVDIPFYFNTYNVVSFSPYPYTDFPDYQKVLKLCENHRENFDNFYIVLKNSDKSEENWSKDYGSFFTDIYFERTSRFPELVHLKTLEDGKIYQVQFN